MKKVLLICICCLYSFVLHAQTEHMKFMGIPLNGTISSFQTKLQAKGIKYDAVGSRQVKTGCRCFKGSFSGEKADFYVYYNEKTKNVYRAKAVITCINKEHCDRLYNSFKEMLITKYSEGIIRDGEQDGHPSLSILVPDSKLGKTLGFVGMYITNPPFSFIDELYMHIDYEDSANKRVNQNKNMDDL